MNTKKLVVIGLFTALMAVLSQIIIPLPSGVPISMGVVGCFLTGAILDKKSAAIAMLIYVALGAFGVPVFAGFKGGLGTILGATGGYIVAYPIMAFVIGAMPKKNVFWLCLSMGIAIIICYIMGTIWLSYILHLTLLQGFAAGVAPYILFDILKIIFSAILSLGIIKALKSSGMSTDIR